VSWEELVAQAGTQRLTRCCGARDRNNRMLLHSNTDHSMFDYPDREMHLVFLDSNVPVVAARAS